MKEQRSTVAKRVDLVTYLALLGYIPKKIKGQDFWYQSPLRQERTPSFKVNRLRNIWYDHGEGRGGNIIDFVIRFFNCEAREAIQKLSEIARGNDFSFHPPHTPIAAAGEKKEQAAEKTERAKAGITILDTRPLQNKPLVGYIQERKISLEIAQRFCQEVDFLLNRKKQFAIGFPNRSGGFELRNSLFKGSSSPKDITFFDNGRTDVCVFEGFFDYLSFLTYSEKLGLGVPNCLVLNSLAFLEKSRPLMENHARVFLCLNRDDAGKVATQKALTWNNDPVTGKYIDHSNFYSRHKDINEWLVNDFLSPKEDRSKGLRRGR